MAAARIPKSSRRSGLGSTGVREALRDRIPRIGRLGGLPPVGRNPLQRPFASDRQQTLVAAWKGWYTFGMHIRSAVVILALFSLAAAVPEPRAPREPTVRTTAADTNQTPPAAAGTPVGIGAVLEDGRRVQGRIRLEFPSFPVRYQADGFVYDKELAFAEIRELRILEWKGHPSARSDKTLHYFYPSRYRVTTRAGVVFELTTRLKLLDSLLIENDFGRLRLFAYFADYWIGEDARGRWENSGSQEFSFNNRNPNGGVVRQMHFSAVP
jgi:hypothetical protein